MNIKIRLEKEKDHQEVENMTREAFWDLHQPGCDEHLLVHKLRKAEAFIPELDFVAELDHQVVGNIMYSRARVIDGKGLEHEVLTFGPLSVLPSHQRLGVGSALVKHTLKLAEEMGFKAIIIFGHPEYYHRFGFANAERFHITTSDGANFEPFMALELYEGALRGIEGRFYEDAVFKTDPAELETFDKGFPYREKHVTDTQFR
jgi:predicted N-acetyltransferase YhbS